VAQGEADRDGERIVLITGASRGIGAAVAEALAGPETHLVLVARTVGGLETTDDRVRQKGGTATLVPLDLRDGEGVERLAQAIAERWGRLDGLVANAGMLGSLAPLAHLFEEKDWQATLDLNVTANWRLLRAFDELLKRSPAGRAAFVSSGAAGKHKPYWGGYTVSKAALEAMALTYAAECANTAVRVNVVRPGPVATAMRAKAMPGEDPSTLPQPEDVAPLIAALVGAEETRSGEIVELPRDKSAYA
jgi:NAD(P)-dependent dehydrogenase (short-subunit alcohol dehydrogenase family)